MCGVCGALSFNGPLDLPATAPGRMIGAVRHRGPDEVGAWRNDVVFLGHARLSIIAPRDGQQPMRSRDGDCHLVCNGEIFNYRELARELERLGHDFRTNSDTEVILTAYLEWGVDCLRRFNGQFAFALWDERIRTLFLARDRFGICPLFVTRQGDRLLFASEVKALKAFPGATVELDAVGMAEVLAYWANPAPGTPFRDVFQLPPGHYALAVAGQDDRSRTGLMPRGLVEHRYWAPAFLPSAQDRRFVTAPERADFVAGLRERLETAVALRLRADVTVGAYLSGGVDSSAVVALAQRHAGCSLRTFGLGFDQSGYDERSWQAAMAAHAGVEHSLVHIDQTQVAARFREVLWHAESPLLRAAAAPLLSLSGHARDHGCRVVLTGEGADEVFLGYNIFRETKVRRFWSRLPEAQNRPRLLTRLYPYQKQAPFAFLREFYGKGLGDLDDPLYSHRPRWRNTAAAGFMCEEACSGLEAGGVEERLLDALPAGFPDWGPVARAQYLEMTLFMSGYLLSSQGDRMLMAHSVEGRFPYLDHELVEYAAGIPTSVKLPLLQEKALLKSSVADLVPAAIIDRPKHPFRAPGSASFAGSDSQDTVAGFLLADGVGWEFWNRPKVALLANKVRAGRPLGPRDDMSFLAVLSGRMLQADFGPLFEDRIAASALAPEAVVWRS